MNTKITQDYFYSYPVTGEYHTNPTQRGHSICSVEEISSDKHNSIVKNRNSSQDEHSDKFRIAANVLKEYSYKSTGKHVGFVNELSEGNRHVI